MNKNDITYEYRVFTNRLIDVEAMEIGICTSKVIKELKPKNKVDGRFFHTSDTDEWYFCWKGELQKLNLKGDSDVNAALNEVKKLIGDANAAVEVAKSTAKEAQQAATDAKNAADAAGAAIETIENKADKSDVDKISKAVEAKADKSELDSKADASDVKDLSDKVNAINLSDYATKEYVGEEIAKIAFTEIPEEYVTESELSQKGYLTEHQDISGKQDKIDDLDAIRSGAALGATAIQSLVGYATEEFVTSKGYVTTTQLEAKQDIITDLDEIRANASNAIKAIPSEYITEDVLSQKGFATTEQLNGKQNEIDDLDAIRSGAALGATAIQSLVGYATEEFVTSKGYLTEHQDISGKQDKIDDLDEIRANATKGATALQSLDNYFTKEEINALIGEAVNITNTILA